MSDDTEAVSTLRAIAHPLRLRILSLLTGAELSAAEVARELDITPRERVLPPAGAARPARWSSRARRRSAAAWPSATGTPGTANAQERTAAPGDQEVYVRAVARGARAPRRRSASAAPASCSPTRSCG